MRIDKNYGLVSCNAEAKLLAKIDHDITIERKEYIKELVDKVKVHICGEHLCREVIPVDKRYCAKHEALHQFNKPAYSNKYEKHKANANYNANKRDQEANAFYHSKRWRQVRSYVVSRDMYTSGVSGRVINDHELIVDHLIPRRLCQDPLAVDNLWCLSRSEHNWKTKLESSMKDNQLKHVSKTWWIKVLREKISKQYR